MQVIRKVGRVPYIFDLTFDTQTIDEAMRSGFYDELFYFDNPNHIVIENLNFSYSHLFTLVNNPISFPYFLIEMPEQPYIGYSTKGMETETTSIEPFSSTDCIASLENKKLVLHSNAFEILHSNGFEILNSNEFEISLYHSIDFYLKTAYLNKATFQEFVEDESFETKIREFLKSEK